MAVINNDTKYILYKNLSITKIEKCSRLLLIQQMMKGSSIINNVIYVFFVNTVISDD